jgi:predicted Zn-dependent protease
MKQQIYIIISSLIGIAVWYLTPISEIIVQELLLPQVPIQSDIDMGRQALAELKQQQTRTSNGRMHNNNRHHKPPQQQPKAFDVYDPHWTPLIESIGWELVDSAKQYYQHNKHYYGELIEDYVWDFGIMVYEDDPNMINAFCLPGGIIRITQNLLQTLKLTEGELAALIGHEMGHAIHRHVQGRKLQHQVLGYVLKAVVGLFEEETYTNQQSNKSNGRSSTKKSNKDSSFGQTIGDLLVKSVDWLGQQRFSRRDEYQADATSWDLLVQSRVYDPRALQSLLEKLYRASGGRNGETSWDSTHPGTKDRIAQLEEKYLSLTSSEKRRLKRENRTS